MSGNVVVLRPTQARPPHGPTELRRALHRLADAASMAHDAIERDDVHEFVRAFEIMVAHMATIRAAVAEQETVRR
jgi:hypothetical protein